ncbi:hypothetical protein [Janthinobacterium sp. RB2R34]|uniref:hypothetical protein n=1 Tax=Janthinobacterium sp. RB2R34 TaxID=3424193 RepID=UPI003F231FDB
MNPLLLIISLIVLLPTADATEKREHPIQSARTKPLQAEYTIYSGELGNEQAPSKSDRKLAIEINGPAAKDIFDSIYPDAKVNCSGEQGERLRSKGNLWCSFLPGTGYRCFLGYDLRTGKDIPGASC